MKSFNYLLCSLLCVFGLVAVSTHATEKHDQMTKELFEKFLSREDLSWACVAERFAEIAEQAPEENYQRLAPVVRNLVEATSAFNVGLKLGFYQSDLPKNVQQLLAKYSPTDLLAMLDKRIKQNGRCPQLAYLVEVDNETGIHEEPHVWGKYEEPEDDELF